MHFLILGLTLSILMHFLILGLTRFIPMHFPILGLTRFIPMHFPILGLTLPILIHFPILGLTLSILIHFPTHTSALNPEVKKLFPCATQPSTKFIPLKNVKMPAFISMVNTTFERLRIFFIRQYFRFNEQLKFCAQLN